jgi:RimJ/RimL family protein N-acetyltransferase/aryl carrier-like protein
MVATSVPANGAGAAAGRHAGWRAELADLLAVDEAVLTDDALLVDDLGLDSLAMMTVVGWLAERAVRLTAGAPRLTRVGDVLALLDQRPAGDRVTLVFTGAGADPAHPAGPADVGGRAEPPPGDPAVGVDPPALQTDAFRLAQVDQADVGFLHALASHPQTSFRWRYRGAPPPLERFAAELWAQVLVQYVVRRVDTDEPAGHVVAYAADAGQGHAYLGAVFLPDYSGTGLAADAVALFTRYLFHTFPLRKLYLEVPGFNWPLLRSAAGRLFEVEGVLRDHDYYAGRYWDKYVCAIYPAAGAGRPTPPDRGGGRTG